MRRYKLNIGTTKEKREFLKIESSRTLRPYKKKKGELAFSLVAGEGIEPPAFGL